MEDRAIYYTLQTPTGPRNLAPFVAAWVRTQGFTATEATQPHLATVSAHWIGTRGARFELDYTWASGAFPESNCRLRVRYAGQLTADVLFASQHVRRLKEVCLLLLGNLRYAGARLLASIPHPAL